MDGKMEPNASLAFVYIFSFLGLERNAAIALIHYDQHWFALSSSNQVIKNKVHLTLHRPACLVFAHTMLQGKSTG